MVVECKIKASGLINEKLDDVLSHSQSFIFKEKRNLR